MFRPQNPHKSWAGVAAISNLSIQDIQPGSPGAGSLDQLESASISARDHASIIWVEELFKERYLMQTLGLCTHVYTHVPMYPDVPTQI